MPCIDLKSSSTSLDKSTGDVIVVPLYSDGGKLPPQVAQFDEAVGGVLARARRAKDFAAESGERLSLFRPEGAKATRVLYYGLGESREDDAEALRRQGFALGKELAQSGARRVVVAAETLAASGFDVADAATLLAEGFALSQYRVVDYKKNKDESTLVRTLVMACGSAAGARGARQRLERVQTVVDGVFDARDLGNAPANKMTPSDLARYARRVAKETGSRCTVLGVPEMKKLGMGGILGVAQGTAEPPRTIILEHKPRGAKSTIVFVGKGVTFDSGGISLKPWKPMWDMKYDMCGAAAVLAGFRALARLGVKHNVVAIVGATENLPDAKAYKPGDVVVTSSGKSIEIHSTDAEGRVVLSDMLHYAKRYKPDVVVDFATLTGAVITALGHHCAAVMGNSDEVAEQLVHAGERSGDRVWQLPLWDEYGSSLSSEVADVCNTGDGTGGSIQGGWFLQQFVDYDWCHVDIAGTAWIGSETGTNPKGGTGFGVRLMVSFADAFGR